MNERIFKYVPYSQLEKHYAQGWIFSAELGPPHNHYSVLLEWPQDAGPLEAEASEQDAEEANNPQP